MRKDIVILPGKRTAFGAFGGSLKDFTANDLGVFSAKGALEAAGVRPASIDHVIFGNVAQTSQDAAYLARHIGLKSGVPIPVPAYTVNRLCGSGFQAIVNAAEELLLEEAEMVLAGGTESMSQAPYVVKGARWGIRMGSTELQDYLWAALTDTYTGLSMAVSTEELAKQKGVSRQSTDEYALRSQMAYKKAFEAGFFKEEIIPIEIKDRKGNKILFDKDEHPKPDTTLEGLSKLKPYFVEGGVVTAGSASGITDGAAAMVVTTAERAKRENLKPIGRLLGWAVSGCDPKFMGIGPALAIPKALQKVGLSLKGIDLIEVNEAFGAQVLAVEKGLGLNREITNVNGGAISVGHPLGASGARITLHLLYELRRRKKKVGIGSACIGGGQGIALVVEAL
ncbi:MAG: acetyl-CoA C-acetyltransferase [Deltaproteobacteria bacterium]|nr:acetyl-CoA C-acetyltransferase [Deltaproteobacteria bacterium]